MTVTQVIFSWLIINEITALLILEATIWRGEL